MDPVRERVRYVGRIGVVFGQRTELWWDHPLSASFDWKRVVWDIPRERYERMLGLVRELLGLDELMNTLARELSLGQRMRADLAMALLHEPEVLFLDEPTLGLDVLARRNILRLRARDQPRAPGDRRRHQPRHGRARAARRAHRHAPPRRDRLRRRLRERCAAPSSDRRVLLLETAPGASPPALAGAERTGGENGRHEYVYDATKVRLSDLLEQAAAQTQILDVETHRAPIDELVADLYERWQREP